MSEYPWAVENRVVKEPIIALFRYEEDAVRFVEDTLDLRVIANEPGTPRIATYTQKMSREMLEDAEIPFDLKAKFKEFIDREVARDAAE